jgi:hypothetical protein
MEDQKKGKNFLNGQAQMKKIEMIQSLLFLCSFNEKKAFEPS